MSLKLTAVGYNLLLRCIAGEICLNFTAIQLGNGSNAGANAAELSNPLLTVGITSHTIGDSFITLTAVYNNSEVEAGFCATETGVLVADPDNAGDNLLYAYEYVGDADAERIQASDVKILETQMDVLVYIGEAQNVTASVSQSMVYVPKTVFDEFVTRRDNPHSVTKDQVGLGNVPNVTPENQTPIFDNAYNTVTVKGGLTSFANIINGDTLGVILRKIRTAIHVLISHLNSNNPHNIDSKTIGAAEDTHYHSATDINSGTLGLRRGGTGGTTASEARFNLGIAAGQCSVEVEAGKVTLFEYSYPKPFLKSIPIVTATLMKGMSEDIELGIQEISLTGFTAFILSHESNGTVTFNWIAVQ